jgi:hypothetical protein
MTDAELTAPVAYRKPPEPEPTKLFPGGSGNIIEFNRRRKHEKEREMPGDDALPLAA